MKVTLVYTMKGCPYCVMIKEELKKNKIIFIERDIDEYEEEYNDFVEAVGNEYVPALMLLTLNETDEPKNITLLAPERDFNDINEGIDLVKNYLLD